MQSNSRFLGVAFLAAATLATGCGVPGKVTGGGTIPSADGVEGHKAAFAFNGQQCDTSAPARGHVEYHDKDFAAFGNGGVKLSGDVVSTVRCLGLSYAAPASQDCRDACGRSYGYAIRFSYTSTNPNLPGTGDGLTCLFDHGAGSASPSDGAVVGLLSGPYAGYFARGDLQGNIESHTCP